jgi:8-oxo-dGTP pyrophosphatase MutT (NUDIX family)
MKLRSVVTCFLRRSDDRRILLGRRSRRVHTYKEHWAGISGGVEEDRPLAQAYREIAEETGLDRADVDLLAAGRSVRFPDWELGVLWVVHPYLFRCRVPEKVRSDWEHLEFDWRDPERIPELQTVPRLWEAYRSAAEAEGRRGGEHILRQVASDREHGAHELGLWTLEALQREARDAEAGPAPQLLGYLRESCREALELRPSMA